LLHHTVRLITLKNENLILPLFLFSSILLKKIYVDTHLHTVVPAIYKRLVGGTKSVSYIESILYRGLLNRGTTVHCASEESGRSM